MEIPSDFCQFLIQVKKDLDLFSQSNLVKNNTFMAELYIKMRAVVSTAQYMDKTLTAIQNTATLAQQFNTDMLKIATR